MTRSSSDDVSTACSTGRGIGALAGQTGSQRGDSNRRRSVTGVSSSWNTRRWLQSRQRDQPRPVPVWRVCAAWNRLYGPREGRWSSPAVTARRSSRARLARSSRRTSPAGDFRASRRRRRQAPYRRRRARRRPTDRDHPRPAGSLLRHRPQAGHGVRHGQPARGSARRGRGGRSGRVQPGFATQTPVASTPLTTAIRVFPHLWTP